MPDDGFGDTPAGGAVAPCPLRTHWIEIELRDEDGNPVANEAYKVKLPSGEINTGYLNSDGFGRLDGIADAGTCQVSFPNIDGDDWKYESSTSRSSLPAGGTT
jgi:hypothetical protein